MRDHGLGRGRRGLCAFLTAVLMLCSCGIVDEPDDLVIIEQEEEGTSYEFSVVERGTVEKTLKISCTYRQVDEQEVSFQITGRLVDKVHVEEGDSVKKGDLLVELSSKDLERRIQDLEYSITRNELLLGYAEINEEYAISALWVNYLNYSGDKNSLDSMMESTRQRYRYQREDYEDAIAADRAEMEQLQRELRNSRVYATMNGIVYDLKDNLGGSTSRFGEVVMTIMDTSERLFETKLADVQGYFTEGVTVPMTVSYGSAAGEYLLMPWHMEEWGETQLFVVYEGRGDAIFEVGVSGTMLITESKHEDVLNVPSTAVYSAEDRRYVYVLNDDNMREIRWVETGLYGDDTVEILSGLTEGEKVILK